PLFCSFTGFVVTRAAWAARTIVITATELVVAFAAIVTACKHGRLAFFVLFNADRHEAQNVFIDALLALNFG
uniref:hypothetical protein n=1 Tax=Klebsiella pneumoniae TaxID=573 RepID=UPI0019546D27